MDNFYTSPTLFRDLLQRKIWACGTLRPNITGCPKTKINALDKKFSRGSIRWIREGSLLFVQWRDTRDVLLCSTMHTAHGEETVGRRTKDDQGRWTIKNVSVPPVVKDYNKYGPCSLSLCPLKFDLFLMYLCTFLFTGTWVVLICRMQ